MQLHNRKEHRCEQLSVFFPIRVKSNIPPGLAHQADLPMPLHKTIHPFQSFFNIVQAGGVGTADIAFPTVAKGAAGNDGDALFMEEAFAEFVFVHAGFADAGEGREGTFGFNRPDPVRCAP